MTIDYKALADRINLYARLGVEGCDRWRDDLRTVVTMLREAAEAKPVAWIAPSTPAPDGADYRAIQQDYDVSGGYGCSAYTAQSRGWLPLFTHPAPQPNWQPVPPRACIKPTHEAADAFWRHWRENGETHKHGYYESTWGAINVALACGWTEPAPQPQPTVSFDDTSVQRVYDILCDETNPSGDEHWEGWVARRIVDALRDLGLTSDPPRPLPPVTCDCGDEYPATSYEAGYIRAAGHCPKCDTKPGCESFDNAADLIAHLREPSPLIGWPEHMKWKNREAPEGIERSCLGEPTEAQIEQLRSALVIAEAALADIGDADREPGDDLKWCEQRAAEALPDVRAALAAKETK